jgi:hypothetical protein
MVCVSLGRVVALKNFYLDESLDWEVAIHREWNSYLDKDVISDQDLVEVLKGGGYCASFSSDDGPEFKALRNQLEQLGYIECQRRWWNGDRVLKAFRLNGVTFCRDEQFCCGAAMKLHLKFERKYKK